MEIKIEDLQIGDEILLLSQVPKYMKIMETPKVKGQFGVKLFTLYANIRCHINVEIEEIPRSRWNWQTQQYYTVNMTKKTYPLEPAEKGKGIIKKTNLNCCKMWLVNREI